MLRYLVGYNFIPLYTDKRWEDVPGFAELEIGDDKAQYYCQVGFEEGYLEPHVVNGRHQFPPLHPRRVTAQGKQYLFKQTWRGRLLRVLQPAWITAAATVTTAVTLVVTLWQ